MNAATIRCPWAGEAEDMIAYHDHEWGVPCRDERGLFELLTLEGAQAGLSWSTILRKREGYRSAFAGFDPERVARFSEAKMQRLLEDPSIVRNRLKVASTLANARAVLDLRDSADGLPAFLWSFVDGEPLVNRWSSMEDVPAQTELSKRVSRELKKSGFRFVGPTVCYSLLQAAGLVNDHLVSCPRWRGVQSS